MDLLDLLDTAAGRTIAWGSALTILAGLLRWGWRLSKRLHQLADAFLGNPDPDPSKHRPSLPERVESIEKQLHPNGGTSLRDAVDGVRSEVGAVRQDMADHKAEHARNPVTVNVGTTTP